MHEQHRRQWTIYEGNWLCRRIFIAVENLDELRIAQRQEIIRPCNADDAPYPFGVCLHVVQIRRIRSNHHRVICARGMPAHENARRVAAMFRNRVVYETQGERAVCHEIGKMYGREKPVIGDGYDNAAARECLSQKAVMRLAARLPAAAIEIEQRGRGAREAFGDIKIELLPCLDAIGEVAANAVSSAGNEQI